MVQERQSELKSVADILAKVKIFCRIDIEEDKKILFSKWEEIVGQKLAKYSSPKELTDDGVLLISCKNSVVANELFNMKNEINKLVKQQAEVNNINFFKYIHISYK